MTLEDLAFEICTALDTQGITAILIGESAAHLYAPDAIESTRLTFALPLLHPENTSQYEADFTKGPPKIGDETVSAWQTLRSGDRLLHILTPTDAVKDRLAHAIREGDLAFTHQAAEIALIHPLEMIEIEAWCAKRDGSRTFGLFQHLILV